MAAELLGRIDFHIHNRPQEGMVPTASIPVYQSKGYLKIGFTDHFDPLAMEEKIGWLREELDRASPELEVFMGTEVTVNLPNWPKEQARRLKSKHLDFCLLSPSHRPRSREVPEFTRLPMAMQASKIYDSFIEAVSADFADVLAHPFAYGGIPHHEKILSRIGDGDLESALELARKNEIAMELSPRVLQTDPIFLSRFLRICKNVGVKFSVGSDAHALESIGNDNLVIPIFREHGIGDDLIWRPERRA
jgi:histidinol phosphatase-like PHP family hydrolase